MTHRLFVATLALATLSPTALDAQVRGSQSNIIFGVQFGVVGGKPLWDVPAQAIGSRIPPDTVRIRRELGSGLGIAMHAAYFPGAAIGFTGEVALLGNSYDDSCQSLYTTASDSTVHFACRAVDGKSLSTSTILIATGVVARAFPRSAVSPYVRLGGGLTYVGRSSTTVGTATASFYDTGEGSVLRPMIVGAAGITARSGVGDVQIRLEVRDNYIRYSTITGPGAGGSAPPPTASRSQHFVSVLLGIDIVLEKSRGRRY